jgi:hypothetical protein
MKFEWPESNRYRRRYASASSSLGVSGELHLTLFPQGSIATRARVAKLKCNYENE